MSFEQSFVAPEARRYLMGLLEVPYPVMEDLEKAAGQEGQPTVGRETGSLLRGLARSCGAKRILEVGCNLGYSALWMAHALPPDGHLDTIEMDAELARRARVAFEAAGVAGRVTVHEGRALDVLPNLSDGAFDLVFLDAAKEELPEYLDHAQRLTHPGAVIAADNMFWLGRAWDASDDDASTRGVRAYTKRVLDDPHLTTTIVPVEDGLAVSVVAGKDNA